MRAKLAWALAGSALLGAAAAGPATAADPTAATITQVRQESLDRTTRLVVEATGALAYTYYSPDPSTLIVDIPEVDASGLPARIDVGTREVEWVKVTSMARADGRSLARLEVRLAGVVPYQIYSKGKNLNLVFERPAETAEARPVEAPPATAAPETTPPVETAPAPPAEAASQPPAPASVPAVPAEPAGTPVVVAPRRPPAAGPASQILGITQHMEGPRLVVTVKADGALRFQDFFLGNPDRLVVDFTDVVSRAGQRTLEVNQAPVRRVRLGQFSVASPKVARLVLDLLSRAPYQVENTAEGVRIVFGEGEAPRPAAFAALRETPAEARPAEQEGPDATAQAVLPAPLPPALPAPQAEAGGQATQAIQGLAEGQSLAVTEKKFTGAPITLDFKDGDLQDIFRLFADISGLNVVINPGVSGKISLKLVEVPWDQALDLILKANQFGYTIEGNVIRIARLADLQKEEQERRKLAEEKALAGDLEQFTARISYAKAAELSDVLKRAGALSARGQINVDARTNTMLIRDLPAYLEKSRTLIQELDRSTPQVEIEARIVVTARNFTRDIGIQWGFLNQQTAQFGNTTNLTFPHSIILNGAGTPLSATASGVNPNMLGLGNNAGIGVTPTPRGYAVNLPASSFNSSIGISMGNILGSFNIDAALTALERQGRGRLLSTPKVTTQNNQAAEIKQGVQIPIQTTANNTVTVQFKDAVLFLRVTPQITEAQTVILQLEVENNSPDFANLVNGIPPINTQSAKTQVLVRDGATAVIGGIYQSNEQSTLNSTPLLGKLPIIGYLFRNRFIQNSNNELLLFITPRIIKS
jgi:type IV pilus assembly protein PilQ